MTAEDVGVRLRQVRRRLGFSRQSRFGKALGGFTADSVSRAERGENYPHAKMLIALAKSGVDLNWLLTGEGEMGLGGAPPCASDLTVNLGSRELASLRLGLLLGALRKQKTKRKGGDS